MSNVRGLRDPRKRWVLHFDLQTAEESILPVCLCYEPGLKEQLEQLKALFAERGSLDVVAWWEFPDEGEEDVILTVVLTPPGSDEELFGMEIFLPVNEWTAAMQRAVHYGRDCVLVSVTANPAVLQLQDDPTSWEVEVPLAEEHFYPKTRSSAEWEE